MGMGGRAGNDSMQARWDSFSGRRPTPGSTLLAAIAEQVVAAV
jgi:hypothetical protein